MPIEKVGTLVVGGGQAGVAMSEHLGNLGQDHLVVERGRIAERWRSERWDSLVANGPAWHDRFPNLEFSNLGPDEFAPKERVAEYFAEYVKKIGAPVRCGVSVLQAHKEANGHFAVQTSDGVIEARNIVAATGPFQKPIIPPVIPSDAPIHQIHSNSYKNPAQLPDGGVLVVGAGSSGVQIAEELLRSGRQVYLSVGPHSKPPRRYRGKDFVWWLGVLGMWDAESMAPGSEHTTIAVSGAQGGHTVDFRKLVSQGMTLLGMTSKYENGVLHFAPDLHKNIHGGDSDYLALLRAADAYAKKEGLDLPEEPEAFNILPDPACVTDPILKLDLKALNINSIIWATGYQVDYGWLKVDAFDEKGRPIHKRGVSNVPGLYFVGLPYLSRRASSFIWGVWHDAKHLADHIANRA